MKYLLRKTIFLVPTHIQYVFLQMQSLLSADPLTDIAYNRCHSSYSSTNGLRRSRRLIKKARTDTLMDRILSIPIYVPRFGPVSETYSEQDKTRDLTFIQSCIDRGLWLMSFRRDARTLSMKRDVDLASAINFACIYVYLCHNPSLLKASAAIANTIKNKCDHILPRIASYRIRYASDATFQNICDIVEKVCEKIYNII